jgi:hypothetical protein
MSKLRIELLVIRATVELTPEDSAPVVVETRGVIPASERPGLAKTRPNASTLRLVGGR